MPTKGKTPQSICQDDHRMAFFNRRIATFVSDVERQLKQCTSGILCAVLRRFPSPWQGFAYGDTGQQPRGWHSTRRWARRKRRRKKLIQLMRGRFRHTQGPREKHRCQRLRRNKLRERALAGHLRRSVEARGGS